MATAQRVPSSSAERAGSGAVRLMRIGAVIYVIGLVLHTADHIRRGTGVISPEVFWLGVVSTAAGVLTVALIAARHRLAPLAASLFGIPVAIGVAAVHLPPYWGVLSDPFTGSRTLGITPFSWFVVLTEIAGAALLGAAAIAALGQPQTADEG